ncbi:MAG: MBL fold metallo-hydrolase [Promethearchaeota archaeon]
MVKLTFLGGCREVGRSGILIQSKNGSKVILDYGIRFRGKERFPSEINTKNLGAIAVTHCHVDHSGGIPLLYKSSNAPLYTNPITLRISEILIKDMLGISKYEYPFGRNELDSMRKNAKFLELGFRQKVNEDIYLTFYDAGHIPGSVSILAEVDDKRILYTGDINNQETNLVKSADTSLVPEIDVLITESTYALREHPSREEVERKFVENVIEITNNRGKVLIPAFGVARSQEALLILEKYNYNGKIFIDGLARKICNIYQQHPDYLKDIDRFVKSLKKAKFITEGKSRDSAKRSNAAIIAPSGMLKGGASMNFVKSFLEDPTSAIYLVGYQAEGSPGRKLLDEGVFEYTERDHRKKINGTLVAKCNREYFNFSSHADGSHLREYVNGLKFRDSSKDVFCVHGDNKSAAFFAKHLVEQGFNAVAPEKDETYTI